MTDTAKNNARIERALRDITSIGRAWAAHGLTVGKSALETSAETLRKTAGWLAGLSARVSPAKTDGPAATPVAENKGTTASA